MTSRVHAIAGLLGLTLIAIFFSSSIFVELLGDEHAIAGVKRLILTGVVLLIPTMIAVGATGRSLRGKRLGRMIRIKQQRMAAIAAIGLLILTPCAVILQRLAADGDFGLAFATIQAVELLGGAVNIALMSLNLRAGLRLTGRIKPKKSAQTTPMDRPAQVLPPS